MHAPGIRRICCAALICATTLATTANAQSTRWWDKYRPATTPPAQPASPQPAAQQSDPASSPPAATATRPGTSAELAVIDVGTNRPSLQPRNAYVEAGYNRVALNDELGDEKAGGAYVRGSLPLTDDLYLFGSHGQVSKTWGDGEGSRLEVEIDQTEVGIGNSIDISSQTAFVTELSYARLSAKVEVEIPGLDFGARDSLNAAKFILGLRSRPSLRTELWAKAGYLWLEDNLLLEDSPVAILGGQLLLTPTWGLVGEAEIYEDLRYFRLGLRASF